MTRGRALEAAVYISDLQATRRWVAAQGGLGDPATLEERLRDISGPAALESWWHLLVLSEEEALEDASAGMHLAGMAMTLLPEDRRHDRRHGADHYSLAVLGSLAASPEHSWTLVRAAWHHGREKMAPLLKADTQRRLSYAAVNAGHPQYASVAAGSALRQLDRHAEMEHSIGCGVLARSYVKLVTGDAEAAVNGYVRAVGMLDPAVGFPVCFLAAQSLAVAVSELADPDVRTVTGVRDQLSRIRKSSPFEEGSVPMLFLDWAAGRLSARAGAHDDAAHDLASTVAGFKVRGRLQDWLTAALDLIGVHLRREDVKAAAHVAWDISGQFSGGRGTWNEPVRRAHEEFRRSLRGGRAEASTIEDAVGAFRQASAGTRRILV